MLVSAEDGAGGLRHYRSRDVFGVRDVVVWLKDGGSRWSAVRGWCILIGVGPDWVCCFSTVVLVSVRHCFRVTAVLALWKLENGLVGKVWWRLRKYASC